MKKVILQINRHKILYLILCLVVISGCSPSGMNGIYDEEYSGTESYIKFKGGGKLEIVEEVYGSILTSKGSYKIEDDQIIITATVPILGTVTRKYYLNEDRTEFFQYRSGGRKSEKYVKRKSSEKE